MEEEAEFTKSGLKELWNRIILNSILFFMTGVFSTLLILSFIGLI